MSTNREKLLAIMQKKEYKGTPWFADLSYLYSSLLDREMLEKRYKGTDGYLKFHEELGSGICFYAPCCFDIYYEDCKFQTFHEDKDIVTIYETPLGSIKQRYKYSDVIYTYSISEHFVNNFKDLKVFEYAMTHRRFEKNYEAYDITSKAWEKQGIAVGIPSICVSPFQSMLSRVAGVEKTIDLMVDYEEEFDAILENIFNSEDRLFEILSESNCEIIEFCENLASDITGKTLFNKYNKSCYKKRINALHKAGKFVTIHIDGALKGCLELLQECGFDGCEAVTPMPIGDLEIEKIRDIAGDDIVIWGGIPGALFSDKYDYLEFEQYIDRLFNHFEKDLKFVAGVADQVPPDANINKVRLVSKKVQALNQMRGYI